MDFFQLVGSISVQPSQIGEFLGIGFTDTMAAGLLLTGIIIGFCLWVSRFSLRNPGKAQIAFELIIENLSNLIRQIAGEVKLSNSIIAAMVSFVFAILFSNLMTTILPFLDSFKFDGASLFRVYTADFNGTLVFAIFGVILTQIIAIQNRGFFAHIFNYIQIPQLLSSILKGPKAFFDAFISFAVGFLDIISEFARVISLSLRLFGNLYAGLILLGVFASFFAILLPIPILLLSTLSGVVQAIVFGALVTSYIAGVVNVEN